jgi:nucleotide-binding universal stress UspA family protein
MTMFTRILVPTDFSPASDAALSYAHSLAGLFHSTLHVLHVTENVFLRAVVADPHELRASALKTLEDRITDMGPSQAPFVAAVESSDEPADEIVSYADAHEVNLIVMGTRGRTGLAHLLMGSVAEKVVRSAPCPVLTLHTLPERAGSHGLDVRRILVPTDFSDPSDAALGYARVMARRLGANVHLLHVLEDVTPKGALGSEVFIAESPSIRTARLTDARERLARRLSENDRIRFHASAEVVFATGSPAKTIANYAGDNGYDLIMIGTHGRKGLGHLIMGSVAEEVVRTAVCPVMTTHAVGTESAAEPVAKAARATA